MEEKSNELVDAGTSVGAVSGAVDDVYDNLERATSLTRILEEQVANSVSGVAVLVKKHLFY